MSIVDSRTMFHLSESDLNACMPEPELLPICEIDEEWQRLREKEIAIFKAIQQAAREIHPCEGSLGRSLRRAGGYAAFMECHGDRIHRQAVLRIDPMKKNKNVIEQ